MTTLAIRLSQFLCWCSGHETLRRFEDGVLCLECVKCLHRSPGWDLTGESITTGKAG